MKVSLAIEWVNAAKLDIRSMKYIINDEFLSPIVAFHSQQAIEKSLKALLVYNQKSFQKIHSLEKLFRLCHNYLSTDKYDLIDLLDSLYIESRYPGDVGLLPHGKPTLEDAKEFYNFAITIFDTVCSLLNIHQRELR